MTRPNGFAAPSLPKVESSFGNARRWFLRWWSKLYALLPHQFLLLPSGKCCHGPMGRNLDWNYASQEQRNNSARYSTFPTG